MKELSDETIMPDGRPLFAWRNEIEMARAEHGIVDAGKSEVTRLMALLRIVELEEHREPHTGDYLFRVRRGHIASAVYNPISALEKAEITRL